MRKFVFLFFQLTFISFMSFGQKVEFKASAPEAVVVGEQFRLSYTLNAEGKEIRIPDLPDFQVLMGPSTSISQSSVFVNGQMVSETNVTYTYILMPSKEGTFTIPEATIKVNNSNYKSNSLSIKVLPQDQRSEAGNDQTESTAPGLGKDDVLMRMIVSKTNVYEQEAFLVTFKFYTTANAWLRNVKFPEFKGFLVQEIELPENKQWTMEHYNGRNYHTVTLKQSLLFPQRTGKITIGEGEYEAVIKVRTQARIRSIFDDFFDTTRDVLKKIKSAPVTIDVKPLPAGKPAKFSGGVGEFNMKTSLSSDHVKANEAVTVKIDISGTGNVRLVKNPEVVFPNDFEVFDPKIETNIRTTASGTTGSKTIEYLAIPRFGGDFEIPAIQFSYFDPKSGTYKTLTSETYKLHVEKGEGGESAPVVSNFTNRENVRFLGQDIRYLKVKGIRFLSKEEMLFGSFIYIMWYIIPALLFIIFFILYRKQIKENSDLALVRTKKANKTAVKRLKIAGKLLKENNKEAFYEEVLRALWGYLSDKLSIPQANLTKDNVEVELNRYGVGEELINEFMEILNTCEFARYAPSQASDAMDKLYDLTVDAIGKMENTIKKIICKGKYL
ncbi:MAG: BatD family protein [Tannerellaceae bacterium]|nr:BatD family protein [Tannerellaceae bacterium]